MQKGILISLIPILLWASITACGQPEPKPIGETVTLSGVVVRDSDGTPIAGATVTAKPAVMLEGDSKKEARDTTDDSGRYEMKVVPNVAYEIKVTHDRYKESEPRIVRRSPEDTDSEDFTLEAPVLVDIEVQVLDEGVPITNAPITVSTEEPGGKAEPRKTPNEQKRFFAVSPGFTYTFRAYYEKLLFSVKSVFQSDLDRGNIPERLKQEFDKKGISIDKATVSIEERGEKWLLMTDNKRDYIVRKEADKLGIYEYRSAMQYRKIGRGENSVTVTLELSRSPRSDPTRSPYDPKLGVGSTEGPIPDR